MQTAAFPSMTIDPSNIIGSMSQDQMCQFANAAIAQGARLVSDRQNTVNFYLAAVIRTATGMAEMFVRVNRELAETTLSSLALGTTLARADLDRGIMPRVTDQTRYMAGEAILVRMLLAATDDSVQIKINGARVTITEIAKGTFMQTLQAFWTRLGASARWGIGDPASRYLLP